ncbi:MAG TPA: MFS transporter [Caldithrix abyssi]|uniref:MFS transporter n=1 Tax=Caldithrix abyssi TaxID=187145 RepID=A0A7V1PTM0_CALAY|nr:MFS transporter [Caldithrix abyssi]
MSQNQTAILKDEARSLSTSNKLFNRNYLMLFQGQFVSRLGNSVYNIAIMIWLKEMTDSGTIMGIFGAVTALPMILMSALGGAVADRFPRKAIIVGTDIISGLAMLVLAATFYLDMPPLYSIAGVFIAGMTMSTMRAFFAPAINAAIPDLVPEKRIAGANSMGKFSEKISQFFGYFFGSQLLMILGLPVLVIANGISYLLSALSESFIKIPQRLPEKARGFAAYLKAFKSDIGEGLRYIGQNRGLKKLLYLSIATAFFSTPIIILLIFYVRDFLKLGDQWYGYLLIDFGLGALAGTVLYSIFNVHGAGRKILLILFLMFEAIGYILLGRVSTAEQAMGLIFIGGVMNGFSTISIFTLMQITTPSKIRGRVFGTLTTLSGAIAPLGMALGGFMYDFFDKDISVIYSIAGGGIMVTVILISLSSDFRRFISYQTPEQRGHTGFSYTIKKVHKDQILEQKQRFIEEQFKKTRSQL